MGRYITRRDFIDGFACAVVAARGGDALAAAAADQPINYPPERVGYRGSQPQDFVVAHGVRDGRRYHAGSVPVSEQYDLVVIGAGIGGLASAFYLQRARPRARILIIDNHDDFGGHARRNEFTVDGRLLLGYGGSESIDAPRRRWSAVARACIGELGIDLNRLEQAYHHDLYPGLGLSSGLFFPRELFGADRLLTGDPVRSVPTDIPAARSLARDVAAYVADWPVDEGQKLRLLALFSDRTDVLAGHGRLAKLRLLQTTSYHDYLSRYFGLDERTLAMFDGRTLDLMASKATAVPALYAWALQYPGFQGLGLTPLAEAAAEDEPYTFHFPDGNASIARLFVRRLIPAVAPGTGMTDIVTARFDYARLDEPGAAGAAAARIHGGGDQQRSQRRRRALLAGRAAARVKAGHAVYAGYSAMLPYICPDLGADQRAALAGQVRAPLVYVNVAVRNWRSWVQQRVHYINNPAGFYANLKLDYPVSLGDYRFPTSPDEPMVLHLVHVPWPDGPIADQRSACRTARAQLYARTFYEFESHARDELSRLFAAAGFDAARDIAAITVNRWGHGYAYEPNPLYDGAAAERAVKLSAAPVGRIHFAGSDAAWEAYADRAIDTAQRAASEIAG